MAVRIDPTPNPNALKFTVGAQTDGPKTFVVGQDDDDPFAGPLLALDGVTSLFMTADFVTISKAPEASWDDIAPQAQRILESQFS